MAILVVVSCCLSVAVSVIGYLMLTDISKLCGMVMVLADRVDELEAANDIRASMDAFIEGRTREAGEIIADLESQETA